MANAVFASVRRAVEQSRRRRLDDAHFQRMYGLRDVQGKGERKSNELDQFQFNLGRSVVNTAASHIASKRPKPKFQTDDADWSLVKKAQACEQAVKGIFAANSAYDLLRDAFIDAAVSSLGCLHVYGEHGRVKIERVFPGELVVDVRDGYYQNPRVIYRLKLVDRYVLAEKFKIPIEKLSATAIDSELMLFFDWLDHDNKLDQVVVIEAWRLGSEKDDKGDYDGRHVICTAGNVLHDEAWKRARFPLVFMRWEKRQVGFFGCGIIEELRGHQRALNYLGRKMADMVHNNSRSTLVTATGAKGQKVNVKHLTNDPATMIEVPFGVNPPFQLTANAVPPELFGLRREIIEDGYAQIGVSQLTATGQVPKGLDSGVAIREAEDVGSRRWSTKVQDYESVAVELARVTVDELRDLARNDKLEKISSVVRKGSRAAVELIDWKKVDLDDNQYTLDRTPASTLPDSTAGRTATVIDWLNAGLCTPEEAKALLDHPDLEGYKSLTLSAREVVLDTIERIIEDGEYHPPEPTDDLELAMALATQSYNKFRLRKVSPDRLELLLEYLTDVDNMLKTASQAAAPAAVPNPALPAPAIPQAAPTAALAA